MGEKNQMESLLNKAKKLLQEKNLSEKEIFLDLEELVEKLNIAHIELDLQNQELQITNEKLIKERQKYEELYLNAPIAYITLNKTGNILQINQTAADLFHLQIHQCRFISVFPFLTGESKNFFNSLLFDLFKADSKITTELFFLIKNEVLETKVSVYTFFDEDFGQRVCRLTLTDISIEKKQIRLSEERFRLIFDSTVDPIYIHDLTGNFLLVNKHACLKMGYSLEEFKKMQVRDIDYIYEDKNLKQNVNVLLEKGISLFEGMHKNKDQNIFNVEVHSQIITYNGDKAVLSIARDITQRKQREKELLKFRTLVNQSPLSIVITDNSGNIEFVNPRFTHLTGYSFEEAKGKNPRILKSDLTPKHIFTDLWKTILRKQIWQGELINLRKNGQVFWEKATIGPILNENGEIENFIALKEDISLHKEMENALRESEMRFRMLFNSINEAIFIFSENKENYLGIVQVNKQACNRYGYTEEEFLNTNIKSLFNFKNNDFDENDFLKNKIENNTRFESEHICKNGEIFPVEITLSWVKINQQKLILFIVRDISERKKAQIDLMHLNKELQISNEELNAINDQMSLINENLYNTNYTLESERNQFLNLLDGIPENIYVSDKESFVIVFANKKLKELYNEDIIGKKCFQVFYNHQAPCDFCTNLHIFERNEPYYWENYNAKLDKYFYMIDRAIKWIDGKQARFQMAIDISKLKKAEKQLQEVNAAKDKFFSIISHDLRSPFNAIIGFSELLIKNFDTLDKNKIVRYIGNIKNAGQSSFKLLENLLEWSRSQTGRIQFEPKKVHLNFVLRETLELMKGQYINKQIKVLILFDSDFYVFADSNMLNTILRNLISNAIKFTPRGGVITIDADEIDDFIEIKIIDTGVGIEEKMILKLFDITEKSSSQGTENETGTGLGLLLCNEFALRHESRINVKSQIDKGSEFSFKLKKVLD
jgi:PAS domain S-box-containing protein